ncbi:NUDIX hydrolase [Streptosporangium sp. NPDC049376]|uniref:NUDIX hydrolase n=1 Tax=Streptosporangium sp. NPDC049376 TaxID=3366192 RepID=UPI0037B10E34
MGGIPLRGELGERARDILAGRAEPVPARDAATVVLLREDPRQGVEVYLLRRTASMAFAAGACVFPGGSVDPRDADQALAWAGPPPAEWARAFRTSEGTARGLVCAAVRETFEESGVLLAGPSAREVVADTTGDDWEADRLALIDRSLSFTDFLARRSLVLRADLLRPWGHWITPVAEPRRFDTRFFVAALPPGQRTRDVGGEADKVIWVRPADALDQARRGLIRLMPPTYRTLREVSAHPAVVGVLAAEREIVSYMPGIAEVDGEMRIVLDDDYGPGVG